MKQLLLAALLLTSVATHGTDADTQTVRIFIFAGQSNVEHR